MGGMELWCGPMLRQAAKGRLCCATLHKEMLQYMYVCMCEYGRLMRAGD